MTALSYLRKDLMVSHQTSRTGSVRLIVHHPETGKTYAFSELSWKILGMVGPEVTVQAAVAAAIGTAEPPAELVASVEGLVAQAATSGLLMQPEQEAGTSPAQHEPAKPRNQLRKEGAFNPFYIRIPLPGAVLLLSWLGPVAQLLFSRAAFAVWCLMLVSTGWMIRAHSAALIGELSHLKLLEPWAQLYLLLGAATCVHELGHAVACERFGIRVKELGLLLYLFQPGAYADVSEAWLLPSRHERIVVTLGGMYFECVLLTATVWAWWATLPPVSSRPSSTHVTAMIFGLLMLSRLAFNLVPFLRLDGYLVLVDVLDMPNLRRRSLAYAAWLLSPRRGQTALAHGPRSTRERAVYLAYALLATLFTTASLLSVAGTLLRACLRYSVLGGAAMFVALLGAVLFASFPMLKRVFPAAWKPAGEVVR